MTTHIGEFTEREHRLLLSGPAGDLETVAAAPAAGGTLMESGFVAVVCHPHPLHGGTMDNKVVTTLARTYRDLGIPVVRFNFRGVGASEGQFDDAVGEVEDLLAVVQWAKACYPGRRLLLAGFSFGSSVAAQASHQLAGDLNHLVLVAPPVERYSYDVEGRFPCPVTVIMGEQDELVDVAGVFRWAESLKLPVEVLRYPEATHFFHGTLVTVKQDLTEQLKLALG